VIDNESGDATEEVEMMAGENEESEIG